MSVSLTYVAGLDVGNGYTKGLITPQYVKGQSPSKEKVGILTQGTVDIPSVSATVVRPNELPVDADQLSGVIEDDWNNNIDVSFSSPLISDHHRHLPGKRALGSGEMTEEFDVVGHRSKAEQELSHIIVLSQIAAKATSDAYKLHGHLPDVVDVHATVALALPIDEYVSHRTTYIADLMGTKDDNDERVHVVTVNNFTNPIVVRIVFDAVRVIPEGASAQYAIVQGGPELSQHMLNEVHERGFDTRQGFDATQITAADVLAATHTIGVDVGEGTVNFAVFTDGKFNHDASRTLNKGYGTVLETALAEMDRQGFNSGLSNRKQLADYLQRSVSPLKRNQYLRVRSYVTESAEFFVRDVAQAFSRVLADVGALTEVAYVYGGGSSPLQDLLHEALVDKTVEMTTEAFPVLYLDSSYSRKLNREGLVIAATTAFHKLYK